MSGGDMKQNANLVILGAGGFARELCVWLRQSGIYPHAFYSEDSGHKQMYDLPVIDSLENFRGYKYLCGIGDPQAKRKLSKYAELMGLLPAPAFVHFATVIGERNELADGVIVCPHTVITTDCKISRNVTINIGCTVGHDVRINAFSTISPGVNISGNVDIDEDVYVGTNAGIREKLIIGSKTIIGMGAAVVKDCEHAKKYTGVPARVT